MTLVRHLVDYMAFSKYMDKTLHNGMTAGSGDRDCGSFSIVLKNKVLEKYLC